MLSRLVTLYFLLGFMTLTYSNEGKCKMNQVDELRRENVKMATNDAFLAIFGCTNISRRVNMTNILGIREKENFFHHSYLLYIEYQTNPKYSMFCV